MLNIWKETKKKVQKTKPSFKEKHSFEKRQEESSRIITKYPERIPVIIEKDVRALDVPDIDRIKYLVPNDLSFSQLIYIIRKRINISAEKSLFFFVNNSLVPFSHLISQIYDEHKDKDGFLYIVYNTESTFG